MAYKIKEIEVITGIKAHTIRIWEKRYNILVPDRTDTKIRTYSDDELTFLMNVSLLNNHGIKISRIAEMSNSEIIERVEKLTERSSIDGAESFLTKALMELDEKLFRITLQNSIETIGFFDTYTNVIMPFLTRIGMMWQMDKISPAQEHFISHLIRQRIMYEIELLPMTNEKPNVILYLPEHESHEFSLLMLHYFLRSNGVSSFYLGQNIPFDSLVKTIELVKPKVLITFSITRVDSNYISHYFNQLEKFFDGLIMASGANLIAHKESIPKVNIFNSILEFDLKLLKRAITSKVTT